MQHKSTLSFHQALVILSIASRMIQRRPKLMCQLPFFMKRILLLFSHVFWSFLTTESIIYFAAIPDPQWKQLALRPVNTLSASCLLMKISKPLDAVISAPLTLRAFVSFLGVSTISWAVYVYLWHEIMRSANVYSAHCILLSWYVFWFPGQQIVTQIPY
jgi:hypothetical protein